MRAIRDGDRANGASTSRQRDTSDRSQAAVANGSPDKRAAG